MTDFNNQDIGRLPATGPHLPIVTFEDHPGQNSSQPRQLSSASSYADLQYLFGTQDLAMITPTPNRNRRKPKEGAEHTKHRRTRSGCYTCRGRRVKCDEAHPICERCKKGGRDCVYPEPSTSTKAGSSSKNVNTTTRESPGSSSDEFEDDTTIPRTNLEAIPDEDETVATMAEMDSTSGLHHKDTNQPTSGLKAVMRQSSETPSLVLDKGASPTPSTEGSIGYPTYQSVGSSQVKRTVGLRSDWSHLPADLQFYLTYFYENVTYLHYSLKYDSGNFLKTLFIDAALRNEALLYAVVGFSAFQRTLHNPEGKIQDFLQYYNKAVSLLLKSLKKGERHSSGTILAILQLATIEEFLGDWINLLGHQKAAFQMLTELYTPKTVMESHMSRVILGWYMRFDVFAGLLGGFEMVLSREWFSQSQDFCQQQAIMEPTDLNWKFELAVAKLRLVAMDMGKVFARIGKGEISFDQFIRENEAVGSRIEAWKTEMDPALQDERYLVNDFSDARALDPNDIVNPYIPGKIFYGPLWAINVSTIDWYSIGLMHKYQTALIMQQQPSPELGKMAFECCQLFESVEFFSGSPPGTILAMQASLGIAALFLPRDEAHSMWARRKLASIESHGYIYPYTFRTKMSDLFRDRSCMHWWLPNDEGYPPIIRTIRKFVEERTSPAVDLPGEDLRDMKAIFASLNLDDSDSRLPSAPEKGKGHTADVAVANSQDWAPTISGGEVPVIGGIIPDEGNPYDIGGIQEYWGEQQGSSHGQPKPGGFP